MNKQDKIHFIRTHPGNHRGMSFTKHVNGHAIHPTFNKILHNGLFQFITTDGGNPDNTRYFNIDLDVQDEELINELYDPIENFYTFTTV